MTKCYQGFHKVTSSITCSGAFKEDYAGTSVFMCNDPAVLENLAYTHGTRRVEHLTMSRAVLLCFAEGPRVCPDILCNPFMSKL